MISGAAAAGARSRSVSRLRLVRPVEPAPAPREFVSGETFLYLGRQYRLTVRSGLPDAHLDHGRFIVNVGQSSARKRQEIAKKLLLRWYRRHATKRFAGAGGATGSPGRSRCAEANGAAPGAALGKL